MEEKTEMTAAEFNFLFESKSRVGQIVASMLTTEQFLKIYGHGWILADGRAVPNTVYAKLVSNCVPDLRGIFLRGKNYGRDIATGNADGDLDIGKHQLHQIASHSHTTVQMIADNNIDGVDSATILSGEHHNEIRETNKSGGNETRPNCVTVNYFICVD